MNEIDSLKKEVEELKKGLNKIEKVFSSSSYNIEMVNNGFILKNICEYEPYKIVCKSLDEILYYLINDLEPGGRYDDKRLYVVRMPGDKNEKRNEYHDYIMENCMREFD